MAEKEGKKCAVQIFWFFLISGGKRKSAHRMEEEDGGVQTLCEAYNIVDSKPDERHLKKHRQRHYKVYFMCG